MGILKLSLFMSGAMSLLMIVSCSDFQNSQLKLSRMNGFKLWPNGILIYEFDKNFNEQMKHKVQTAASNITNETDIEVISKEEADTKGYKIGYTNKISSVENGCSAKVGYREESQMYLSTVCEYGTIMHEFFHVLGIAHEQVNPKFEGQIKVNNIQKPFESQFEGGDFINSLTDHDRLSIMHYGSDAFSICGNPNDPKLKLNQKAAECVANGNLNSDECYQACATIVGKKGELLEAQRDYLTASDKEGINKLYSSVTKNRKK